MKFIWRHYQAGVALQEGTVKAPCRVTAKRKVTEALKFKTKFGKSPSWREKRNYTIASVSDLRGIQYPLSHECEFVIFFEPDHKDAMLNELTDPKDVQTKLLF